MSFTDPSMPWTDLDFLAPGWADPTSVSAAPNATGPIGDVPCDPSPLDPADPFTAYPVDSNYFSHNGLQPLFPDTAIPLPLDWITSFQRDIGDQPAPSAPLTFQPEFPARYIPPQSSAGRPRLGPAEMIPPPATPSLQLSQVPQVPQQPQNHPLFQSHQPSDFSSATPLPYSTPASHPPIIQQADLPMLTTSFAQQYAFYTPDDWLPTPMPSR
ncbi:hypothetical protein P7C73_g5657, partial [Tremellales sp. Uapishka_1]